jgi:hypothetical protein
VWELILLCALRCNCGHDDEPRRRASLGAAAASKSFLTCSLEAVILISNADECILYMSVAVAPRGELSSTATMAFTFILSTLSHDDEAGVWRVIQRCRSCVNFTRRRCLERKVASCGGDLMTSLSFTAASASHAPTLRIITASCVVCWFFLLLFAPAMRFMKPITSSNAPCFSLSCPP